MGCRRCRLIRTVFLAVLLGGAAGFGVLAYGGSRNASMAATFFGALLPVLWYGRRRDEARRDG